MSQLPSVLATSIIPLVSATSVSVFLFTHPSSPLKKYVKPPIQLPVHHDEALDGLVEKDAFDIDDSIMYEDGLPVDSDKFWRSTRRWKITFWWLMFLPLATAIIHFVSILGLDLGRDTKSQMALVPIFLASSQIITLLLAWTYLGHQDTSSHWNSTIHLAANVTVQFLITASLALLPSRSFPSHGSGLLLSYTDMKYIDITKALLPILTIPPLWIILSMRRGPPLHFPLTSIYPPKINEAIPHDADGMDPTKPNVSEEVQATIPEWLLFSYATNVVRRGARSDGTDVWDLPVLPASMRSLPQYTRMKTVYGKQKRRLGKWEGYNLLLKIVKANKTAFLCQSVLTAVTAVAYYAPHYVLNVFIVYLQNDPSRSAIAWGWLLAFGLFVSNVAVNIIAGIIWSISTTTLQAGIRLQLNTMLFSKTLVKKDIASTSESPSDKENHENNGDDEGVSSKSQIMTLFTVDVDRVTDFVWHEFALIDAPLEIAVATVFLFNLLGTSALFGLLATILCLPLNHIAAKVVVTAQENLMKSRDQRTALMNEILQGIRMLKFMAWERSFERRIDGIRQSELHWQARNYMIEVGFNCVWALTPVLVTVVSFLHFTLVAGQDLTPSIAFTSVAVFAELRYALNALPETFIEALQGFVSCRRIEKYMSSAEVAETQQNDDSGDIILQDVTFAWPIDDSTPGCDSPDQAFTLANMNIRFPQGRLSLICGRLGSGKSLLLNGLLGEADLIAGQMFCPRSSPDLMASFTKTDLTPKEWIITDMVAYVPQQAWLQNASVRDNIIFSSPFEERRYQQVLEACCLLTDLEIMEDGDQTEIGEKGLNLSGGQKARVSLARAVYSRAGVLFLDDVLSAVDAHTAHALMENCLKAPILHGRTVLLVSHHTTLVSPAASYIVALDNGNIKFSGTRDDFVAGGLMEELEQEDAKARFTEAEHKEEETIEERQPMDAINKNLVQLINDDPTPASETSSLAPADEVTLNEPDAETVKAKTPRKLIEDEQRAKGRIAWPVWRTYFSSLGGFIWWILFSIALILAMLVPVAENGWLSYWTKSKDGAKIHTPVYFVSGYAIITLVGVFASNIQYAVIYYGSLRASRRLHQRMLKSVLFSTLRFHDTTSRGRLLNRFGKDIEGLDSSMADNFLRSLSYGLSVITTFVSVTYVGGLPFLAVGCLLLILYYRAGSIYGQTSRDMRRLDSVTRSPLYSLFGETVNGVAILRAFGASTISLRQMMRLADTNMLAFYWSWTVNRWLSARYNVLSSIVIDASMAGFALAFASGISHDLLFVVRRFVQLEQSMVALERIKEYSELAQEGPEFVEPRPPASWPEAGAISVDNLVIRYAPDLPNVLHGVSFEVVAGSKVGIVGATGCGKSTLALSFFRFVEATEGSIVIDGIDIAKIGLTDLRSRVTIIPQDPTILSGTLRSSLDVFDEYDDAEIYAALKRVHLLTDDAGAGVRNVNVFRDLNSPVSEGGDNFSSGQKQLMCMARAILRCNRVLFMDEATASIDYETDELISQTVREEFSDSTILTIAHRIHTIIDFDKVIVMDRGKLVEHASPADLLRDHRSKFYALCKATGKTEFNNLKRLAMEAERKRGAYSVI